MSSTGMVHHPHFGKTPAGSNTLPLIRAKFRYVVEGFNPVMPNWKELQLTEKDLADIVAYLKTLTGE